jgi:M6 family metalloprotease-like protein
MKRAALWRFALAFAAVLVVTKPFALAVSLTDFGYQSMRVTGQLPLGTRPLLIIRTDVKGDDNVSQPMAYYEDLVFNFFRFPSVSGYMLTNSLGRFAPVPAGSGSIDLIHYIDFTETERASLGNDVAKAGHSINAAARGGFDFAAYDADANGYVTSDELLVLVIENHGFASEGAARWANPQGAEPFPFQIEGSSVWFFGKICLVKGVVDFATLCHEVSHVLDAVDVYGDACLSGSFTLMSCTQTAPYNLATYHFDPWHKLQLGWCEPRIVDLRGGGVVTLSGSASTAPDKQVILYDSQRGTTEYFILEYRSTVAGSYDDNLRDAGLVIWHVEQDAAHHLLKRYTGTPPNGEYVTMWAETPPNLSQGGRGVNPVEAWHSGATTPVLKWNDESFTTTTLRIRPFAAGDASIAVEIRTARDTWVDFAFAPPPAENGTFGAPYNTLAEGVNFAPWFGTIFFKSGATSERGRIDKSLILKAPLGPVTLGQ